MPEKLAKGTSLNLNWFLSLDDAREKIEAWRLDYNEYCPHQSLNDKIP